MKNKGYEISMIYTVKEINALLKVFPTGRVPKERPASFLPRADDVYLSRNKNMSGGSLCLASTRVLVEPIIKSFDQGYTVKDILEWYPAATKEGVAYVYGLWKGRRSNLKQ